MSIAGIRSNRGDGYQTLVAFDWALSVLSDPDFEWLEVDSVSYSVDDVVVSKVDGTVIACQCKKNQTDFKAWSIADLGEELDKAISLLADNPMVNVRFYSRNNFGDLAKLKEHSLSQPDEINYQLSLGKAHKVLDETLSDKLAKAATSLSTFEFLRRTHFVTSDDFERMKELLYERLRNLVSNPGTAFRAIWVRLDQLGARMDGNSLSTANQHRLTKDDLRVLIQNAGATLVSPMDLAEVRQSFSSISVIGRSWRRDIAGQYITNPVLSKILAAIEARKSSILLTGLPGSGKTCVMLELQEILEERAKNCSDIVSLFIQSREFADLATTEERQAQGLSQQWVEKAARLAESTHVIVVVDSLDVLSIAREHRVLQYFLAQIDRLLLIPNVTVVTACRDFDRQYDRRIAERQWECELKIQPLKWDDSVAPLLGTLGITTDGIDVVTRQLICNPRELALFVELALRGDSANVVTSQALAQRYINTVVLSDSELGDIALKAIEALATEMLRLRSLTIPQQRFPASLDIQRKLCSLNVLQETEDGRLTFGHQTLLDILVISRAIRDGVTLNEFISNLPPVPFVRPSIRSFIAQLAMGERREFRKQVRAVLTGKAAFHIKRLAAESFSEQKPLNDDWPLIHDLRQNHRDVFQVIYISSISIEWHHFWNRFLIPNLKASRDIEGLGTHVHRIAQWANDDISGVLSFWMDVLSLDWFGKDEFADQLAMLLQGINSKYLIQIIPLLKKLLAMPLREYSVLGEIVAKCSDVYTDADILIWQYITNGVTDENVLEYRADNILRCRPYEFGNQNEKFLRKRMVQSSALLDLAINSIEHWSQCRASKYGETRIGYRYGFLGDTSYEKSNSLQDKHHADSIHVLFDAVEAGVHFNAKQNTDWWQRNSERLCFNQEGALLYFAILACTTSPGYNVSLISRMLCNRNILEFELSYELGALIQSAFRLLSFTEQDAVMKNILTLREEDADGEVDIWTLKAKAELIISIPCYLRSPDAQAVVDCYEKKSGILFCQPHAHLQASIVRAPFSFEEFFNLSDDGVLKLLTHYNGHSEWDSIEFLVGGQQEVGRQLQEACSRQPSRFLSFMSNHWTSIPDSFRDDIMRGATTYLAHRCGNLIPNEGWKPIENSDNRLLVSQILDELEKHSMQWKQRRIMAKALEACSNIIHDQQTADRLIFLAVGFAELDEEDPIKGDSISLIDLGLNMAKGAIVEALMILADNFNRNECEYPTLLEPVLRWFASDKHPAIRAILLRRLPVLQSKDIEFGWDLFHIAMKNPGGLWKSAERCLYYGYHKQFNIVKPILDRLHRNWDGNDMEVWGRISALASLSQYISLDELINDLSVLENTDAWYGAVAVWTNFENIRGHREQCFIGIGSALNANGIDLFKIAKQSVRIFHDKSHPISVPIEIVRRIFTIYENDCSDPNRKSRPLDFHEWLNSVSQSDPEQALVATEIYLNYMRHSKQYMYDRNNSLNQLMTRLFGEAEEREESDDGAMLQRVVALQDILLSMGVKGIADWLKAAERP
ncbi:AAA family ATPase [Enterobacter sp. Acro-832]|uniref:AAA family ATPase n=1 Tax=Enterobacter sp. Acro-832 TaxID=2608348 RepID=UPI00141E2428|nr:AAA family ATPase [Enterobacter sp. Acro-832]NIG44309.1 AAA family ATPase [Enterobacter sp. Acro-832]